MAQDATPDLSAQAGSAFTSTTFVLAASVLAVIGFLIYDKFRYKNVWAQYGVFQPNISPSGLVNVRDFPDKLMKKYGDTIGIVSPSQGSILMTRDLDILKNVMVKDFNNFVDRATARASKSPLLSSVFFARGARWRRLRQITTPSFSTGKLKGISKNVEESARKFTDFCLSCAEKGRLLPLKDTTAQYTSEIIARTAFGVKTDSIGKEEDDFTKYARNMFKNRSKLSSLIFQTVDSINGLVNFLVLKLNVDFFDPIRKDAVDFFGSMLETTIPERRRFEESGGRKPADLLQAFISSQTANDEGAKDSEALKPLTDDEVFGQSMVIVFAGFETTATTLQMAIYLMAQHPDVQEKVYEEIQSVVTSDSPSHEELGNLKYTEQVINETLRLFPPLSNVRRKAKETRKYGDVTIPAGSTVWVPISSILMDSKHWPNPQRFDPDRFSEEAKSKRDPLAFMAFGYGPRLCIGMRLAYLELKIGLVYVMRKVRFELNELTEPQRGGKVKVTWRGLLTPEKPIRVACVAREGQ